jgi:outer membrane protein assembly factor BamB
MKSHLLTAAAAAALAFAQPACADPASNYQIDAAHDGQIRFKKDFHAPLKQRWTKDLGGIPSYPVFGDGLVFVTVQTNGNDILYALKPKTGDIAWQVTLQDTSAPAYDGGKVFIMGLDGLLQAYDAKTGAPVYQVVEQQEQLFDARAATASDGMLYFTGENGGSVLLFGIRENQGKGRFANHADENRGASLPALGGGNVYIALPCDEEAHDASKGKPIWVYHNDCNAAGGGTPVYFDNRIYADDRTNQVVLDATTGALVRPFVKEEFVPAFWTPASGDALGFVVDGTAAKLAAFDTVTGSTVWSVNPMSFSTPPLVVNDTIFIGDFNGTLHAFDPATGTQVWSQDLGAEIGALAHFPTGLGAGDNMLLVPAGNTLSAWVPKN